MRRPAITASVLAGAASLGGLVAFAADSHEFSPTAVALIGIGLVTSLLVSMVGFLLVRAPWGRWALVASVTVSMLLASAAEAWIVSAVYIGGAVAIAGLVGPWLRFWTRKLPSADSPGLVPALLMATAPVAPLVVGIGAYTSDDWRLWLSAFAIVASAALYSWSLPGALWLMRVVFPLAGSLAVAASPLPSSLVTATGVAVVTVLAWSPAAGSITSVPSPVLPAPLPSQREDPPDAAG